MPADVVVLVATAVLACVALVAAFVATRAARRITSATQDSAPPPAPAPTAGEDPDDTAVVVTSVPERHVDLVPRVVEGRVVVPPTREEVVATRLSRPQVRISVLAHGIAAALRPESRDRIAALVRREYRERRRYRLRAGRRAQRAAHLVPTPAADQWLGRSRTAEIVSAGDGGTGGGAGPRAAEDGTASGRAIGA